MTLSVGIEIGGTKLQAGVGEGDGRLLALARLRVDASRGAAGIREALPGVVDEALARAGCGAGEIAGIGVGFGGPVDAKAGRVLVSHQVEGWGGFPLADWIGERWRVPVALQNDAKAAAYAEATRGAGVGCRRVFYVTVGSGVGGGLVVDGVIDEGQGLGAGEIGHTWVPHPLTGQPVELELIASGWSIARRAREALERGERSRIRDLSGWDPREVTGEAVRTAAEFGDPLARTLIGDSAKALAVGISNVIALLHPGRVIVGGGVSGMGDAWWDPLLARLRELAFKPFAQSTEVGPAWLGEEVVVIGAVLLGLRGAGAPATA